MANKRNIDSITKQHGPKDFCTAWNCALKYAGHTGFVASMPNLLTLLNSEAKNELKSDIEDGIWDGEYASISEEIIYRDENGRPTILIVHGGGMLSPERVRKTRKGGLIQGYAVPLTEEEEKFLLEGKMGDGTNIPIFTEGYFMKNMRNPPTSYGEVISRYGIRLDFNKAKHKKSGMHPISKLKKDPLFLARAGSHNVAHEFLDNVGKIFISGRTYGDTHMLDFVNPNDSQANLLFLSNSFEIGIVGGNHMGYSPSDDAVFVATDDETNKKLVPKVTIESKV